MKKLFTLALALMVVVGGFSQARSVSKKDMRAAQTYQAARTEGTLTNVQSHPNMTRTDGELDYSYYDWQSNDGARTWTIAWPDGKVSFAYTIATDENYSDRGTGIGTYDPEADEWIHCDARVEPEKTGFGSIARYDNNSIIVAAHTATECGVYFIEDKDNITPGCATLQSHLENSNEPTWPAIMTSGTNRNIVHVVALGYSDNMIYYYRSQDRGETWDKENVVLPFLTTEYGSDYNSNCYHWMETTDDNCLALVINNAWCDGMVIYSYDNGETWERKVYYHHPGINTTYDTWFMYPRYVSAQWASNGELRMAYEFNGTTGEPGSGSYYPGIGGVAFYRGEFLTRNCKGIYDTACREFFPYPALTPRMTWQSDTIPPLAPTQLTYTGGILHWQAPLPPKGGLRYNIYGSNLYPVDITKAENLLAVNIRTPRYELSGRDLKVRHYAVTAIDRFGNESPALQEVKPTFGLPQHIDVPRLINRDLKGTKTDKKVKVKSEK